MDALGGQRKLYLCLTIKLRNAHMKTEDTSQQDGIGTDKSSAGGDAVGVPSGAWFGLFAAHAPEIPTWFKRKEWREKVVEPMPESPDGRTGWVHEVMKDRVEEPMDYLVRWRMAYAAAMVAALPNNSEETRRRKPDAPLLNERMH